MKSNNMDISMEDFKVSPLCMRNMYDGTPNLRLSIDNNILNMYACCFDGLENVNLESMTDYELYMYEKSIGNVFRECILTIISKRKTMTEIPSVLKKFNIKEGGDNLKELFDNYEKWICDKYTEFCKRIVDHRNGVINIEI
jgi:hypothetical protein